MTGVLVFGALHHDVVVDAPALPRPDETLPGTAVDYRFGGKGGNQAVAAARMGATVSMVGRIGADAAGQTLLATLDAAGIDRRHVAQTAAPTGMSVAITLPDGNYGAVIVSGANLDNTGSLDPTPEPTVAVIQNEVPETANTAFVRALPEDCRLIWNAAPAHPLNDAIARRTDLLVVNRLEAADLSGTPDPETAARSLVPRIHGEVIVTLGADGALLAGPAKTAHHRAMRADPVSTHGAGDMFTGALAARLAAGDATEDALRFALAAASLFVACEIAKRQDLTPDRVRAAMAP